MRTVSAASAFARAALAGPALVATLLLSSAALAAMDPKAVADALGTAYASAAQKGVFEYESAEARGDDVVISNMSISGSLASYYIGEIVVSAPAPRGDKGGFTASRVVATDSMTFLTSGMSVSLNSASTVMEDITVLPPGETDPLLGALRYRKGVSTGLEMEEEKLGSLMTATRMTYERTDLAAGARYALAMEGVSVPISVFGEDEGFAALGYSGELRASMRADATFDEAAGTLAIEPLSITVADVGTLALSISMAGLAAEKIMDTSLSMEERMLAIYTSGTLVSAAIRFDNAGIVERLLDKQAKSAGVARPALATSMARALPLMLSQAIPDVTFRGEFANAAGKFLQEPKAIVISGAPETPLPLASLLLSVEKLPAVLRLKARAEQ